MPTPINFLLPDELPDALRCTPATLDPELSLAVGVRHDTKLLFRSQWAESFSIQIPRQEGQDNSAPIGIEGYDGEIGRKVNSILERILRLLDSKANSLHDIGVDYNLAEASLERSKYELSTLLKKLNFRTLTVEDIQGIIGEHHSKEDLELTLEIVQLAFECGRGHQKRLVVKQQEEIQHLKPFLEREEIRIRASLKGQADRADSHATRMKPILDDLKKEGIVSLRGIADRLNTDNVACSKKGNKWYPSSVKIVKERIQQLELQTEGKSR